MTRPPRPPRPETRLTRLLARLRDELHQIPIDPDLGRHVETRIREGPALPRPERGRAIPGWAAIAACVLLTLGAGLSTRSAPVPPDHGAQLPLAPAPWLEEEPEPPPIDPGDEPVEDER